MSTMLARPVDKRLDPGAYITDRRALFQVIAVASGTVRLENCRTGFRHSTPVSDVLARYEHVKGPAPDPLAHLDFQPEPT